MRHIYVCVATLALVSSGCDKPVDATTPIEEGLLGSHPLMPASNPTIIGCPDGCDPCQTCVSGVCRAKTCTSGASACVYGGFCNATTGLCVAPSDKPDGTATTTTCQVCNGAGGLRPASGGTQTSGCNAGATTCSGADVCDGSGNCLSNNYGYGTGVSTCVICDGSGNPINVNNGNQGPNCTAGATTCSGADTCNGAGGCNVNDYGSGTAVSTCVVCNGAGSPTNVANGTQGPNCSGGATACSNADTCNGAGGCNPNNVAAGTFVSTCVQCDGNGSPQNVPNGTQQPGHCDAAANPPCSAADSCNGAGACDPRDTPAGTFVATCTECNGAGAVRNTAAGASQVGHCDTAATVCSAKDTCNGAGACQPNDIPDGQTPAGVPTCSACNGAGGTRPVAAGTQGPNCLGKDLLPCDSADTCDGAGTCNLNTHPGVACSDANTCTKNDICNSAGACIGTAYTCATSDECQTGANCDGTGGCTYSTKPDTTVCGDTSKKCTPKSCVAGTCTAKPVICVVQDCHAQPHCDDNTGNCIDDTPLSGGACGGNACYSTTGTCTAGNCSATAVDCSAKTGPCSVGLCDVTLGCQSQNSPNGTACTADACHTGTTCNAGDCGTPIDCPAQGPCYASGCDPKSGCTNNPLPKGSTCDPTDDCQQAGSCDGSGVCTGTPKSDGSFCRSATCATGAAMCVSGACTCPGTVDLSATSDQPDLGGAGAAPGCGCTVGGALDVNTSGAVVLLLVMAALVLRRRGA